MEYKEVTVSTGVRFRLRPPSNYAINMKQREMAAVEPTPPKVWIEEKSREEENPNDPTYLAAVSRHLSELALMLYDVVVCTGSEAIEIPDSMMGQDSEEFLELLGALRIPVGGSKIERYLQWVKVVATPDPVDWNLLMHPLMRLAGETEEDVAEAATAFPGDAERSPNNGTRPTRRRADRDKLRSTPTRAGA